MFINDLAKALKIGYQTNRPLLISSAPGIGKSDSVRAFGKELGRQFNEEVGIIEIRGASLNPGEMADISYVSDNVVLNAPQDWVPTEKKIKEGRCPVRGIIFLDELGDALMSIQSNLQRLLLDGKLGSQSVADGWYCVAATNRAKDKAAAGRISTALINRCIHIQLETSADAFYSWGTENGIDPRVLAFVRFRPDSLISFDPSKRLENLAFCSPRSMEMASDLLKTEEDSGSPLLMEMITGVLGDGVGSELNSFLQIMDSLPDLNEILKRPDTYPIPSEISVAYATIGALTAKVTKDNVTSIVKYFVRFGTELSIIAIKDLSDKEPKTFTVPEFVTWSSDHLKFAI